ncbi:MAG: MTH1187 family thiamine-binding protein [Ignisphaera sp.]|uniref:MTH1187 family thiamine-binding protein n=1 Tax=Ignisphaera aggregans TaxID=334771 RepID=A0A7J3MYD8_9CREN
MAIILELKVIPIGTSTTSLSSYIARVVESIARKGYSYILGPMGTVIEINTLDEVSLIVEDVVKCMREQGVDRVLIHVYIDVRFDKDMKPLDKVKSVEEKLKV